MIRKIISNLWTWVAIGFLLLIAAWVWTIMVASEHRPPPVEDNETLERQPPPEPLEN